MTLDLPPGWMSVARTLVQGRGAVLLVGTRDTGKSTFAAWLAAHAVASGLDTWLVDADVGQSDVGPPSTIGATRVTPECLAPFDPDEEDGVRLASRLSARHLWFVGAHSPRAHMLDCVLGTGRLVDQARAEGADFVIVNPTGWVEGGAAATLKTAKIDLVRPRFVVALERKDELHDVLEPWSGSSRPLIVRCPISPAVQPRDPACREQARWERWSRYLEPAHEVVVDLRQVGLSGSHRAWIEDGMPAGRAIGLIDPDGECLGAGPVRAGDGESPVLRVLAPVAPGPRVARVHFGAVTVPGFGDPPLFRIPPTLP